MAAPEKQTMFQIRMELKEVVLMSPVAVFLCYMQQEQGKKMEKIRFKIEVILVK